MDIDAFVAAHSADWRRLEALVARARRPGRCSGAELDELVDLYQRTATHLSVVRTASPDPQLVSRLSTLVARARAVIGSSRSGGWAELARFVTVTFPVAVYRVRWWVAGSATAFLLVAFGIGIWVWSHPDVQRQIAAPELVEQLVTRDFEDYYSSGPATSFSAQVFTNNAQVGALAFASGILLGIPTAYVLLTNAMNVGVTGGLMAAHGRGGLFFGLILPHGLIELTAVFVAAGVGLKLGWTVVDPGNRRRGDALAAEGRSAVAVVLGLVGVFFVAGLIEAFVTPSGLPTWARLAVGILVEAAFLGGVIVLGRRGLRAGATGDIADGMGGDVRPVS